MYCVTFVGAHALVVMLSVSLVFPVFLTYIVVLAELPGVSAPQSMVIAALVHALSVYTPTLIVDTLPLVEKDLFAVSGPSTAYALANKITVTKVIMLKISRNLLIIQKTPDC
jgi:hypothetical protein